MFLFSVCFKIKNSFPIRLVILVFSLVFLHCFYVTLFICKIFCSRKGRTFTTDPIPITTFLKLTTFLQYSAPTVPDSSNPNSKYLSSETHRNYLPFILTSHTDSFSLPDTTTLLLSALTFRLLFQHASTLPIIVLLYSSIKEARQSPTSPLSLKPHLKSLPYHFYFLHYPVHAQTESPRAHETSLSYITTNSI